MFVIPLLKHHPTFVDALTIRPPTFFFVGLLVRDPLVTQELPRGFEESYRGVEGKHFFRKESSLGRMRAVLTHLGFSSRNSLQNGAWPEEVYLAERGWS